MNAFRQILATMTLAAAGSAAFATYCSASPRVLHESSSELNDKIIVLEHPDGVRELRFEHEGATQSSVRPGAPLDLQLGYTRTAMLALAEVPEPKRILVIGLGGGAMPMFLRTLYPRARVDAVDIDRKVVEVAREWFAFKVDEQLRAHVADGRKFVEGSEGGYDLIFLDAYGKSSIPRHLATAEFLTAVRGKLAPGGLAVGNVWAGYSNPLYGSMRATWIHTFSSFCELDVPLTGNRIFLARSEPEPFDTKAMAVAAKRLVAQHELPFDLADYAWRGCMPEQPEAPVLRDADAGAAR
jgi:spermidine synthase